MTPGQDSHNYLPSGRIAHPTGAKIATTLNFLIGTVYSEERDKRMATRSPQGITQLLERWSQGDEEALDQLMPLVYAELHRLAGGYLRRWRREPTLEPPELGNEGYL